MNIVLLSGGSGKRLWPLSNEIRSKQFLKLFKTDSGYESMVQRVYSQIKRVNPESVVTIATSKSQVSIIHNQLSNDVNICVEPFRRDTFPAIVLASSYLHDVLGVSEDEAIVVCPVDPYVEDGYYRSVNEMYLTAKTGKNDLVLMGIKPTYPSEKYGYIRPVPNNEGEMHYSFVEKPSEEKAIKYISEGALWNGGVFAFKISYVLRKAEELLGYSGYKDLYQHYESLKKISFDYAVVEREKSIGIIKYDGQWSDIGTWNTLTNAMNDTVIGDAILDDSCDDVHVINELDIPIIAMGIHNAVISASPDGILVSDKEKSCKIKEYVEAIDRQAMFAEKSWGTFKVIDAEKDSLTIKIVIKPKDYMNYHSHDNRDEVWIVVSGKGKAVVDGNTQEISSGSIVVMKAGSKHTVFAETELIMIEVQLGKDITVQDKHKYPNCFS